MSKLSGHLSESYVVKCPHCGGQNRVGAHGKNLRPICAACRTPLPPPRWFYVKRLMQGGLILVLVGALGWEVFRHHRDVQGIRAVQRQEWGEQASAHAAQLADLHAAHAAKLADPAWTNGALAGDVHGAEMERRRNFDPAFAVSGREKAILEMAALAEGGELSDRDVLKKVAQLSAPRDAEVLVFRSPLGQMVFVSFDMAALTHGEYEAITKHDTKEELRREVESLMAQVFKDMFIHCGRKNMASVTIGCKHGVAVKDEHGGESVVERMLLLCRIHRRQADRIRDWRDVHADEVIRLWKVVEDYFPHIRLVETSVSPVGRWLHEYPDDWLESIQRRNYR